MADPTGFLRIGKKKEAERPIAERVRDYREITIADDVGAVSDQARRCMDCGIPFCHRGCPLGNLIPEWNDLVARGRLAEAAARLPAAPHIPPVTRARSARAP